MDEMTAYRTVTLLAACLRAKNIGITLIEQMLHLMGYSSSCSLIMEAAERIPEPKLQKIMQHTLVADALQIMQGGVSEYVNIARNAIEKGEFSGF